MLPRDGKYLFRITRHYLDGVSKDRGEALIRIFRFPPSAVRFLEPLSIIPGRLFDEFRGDSEDRLENPQNDISDTVSSQDALSLP